MSDGETMLVLYSPNLLTAIHPVKAKADPDRNPMVAMTANPVREDRRKRAEQVRDWDMKAIDPDNQYLESMNKTRPFKGRGIVHLSFIRGSLMRAVGSRNRCICGHSAYQDGSDSQPGRRIIVFADQHF
jgi:hypothetical protein